MRPNRGVILLTITMLMALVVPSRAATLFYDDFEDGLALWDTTTAPSAYFHDCTLGSPGCSLRTRPLETDTMFTGAFASASVDYWNTAVRISFKFRADSTDLHQQQTYVKIPTTHVGDYVRIIIADYYRGNTPSITSRPYGFDASPEGAWSGNVWYDVVVDIDGWSGAVKAKIAHFESDPIWIRHSPGLRLDGIRITTYTEAQGLPRVGINFDEFEIRTGPKWGGVKWDPPAPRSHPATDPLAHDNVTVTATIYDATAATFCYRRTSVETYTCRPMDRVGPSTYQYVVRGFCAPTALAEPHLVFRIAGVDDAQLRAVTPPQSITYDGNAALNEVFCASRLPSPTPPAVPEPWLPPTDGSLPAVPGIEVTSSCEGEPAQTCATVDTDGAWAPTDSDLDARLWAETSGCQISRNGECVAPCEAVVGVAVERPFTLRHGPTPVGARPC